MIRLLVVVVMVVMKGMMMDVAVDRVVHGRLMVRRVGTIRRAVGRGAIRMRGADRAAGHVSLVQIKPVAVVLLLLLLFLAQQLLQEPRVLAPDARRHGGGGDGAPGVAGIVGAAVMMMGQ